MEKHLSSSQFHIDSNLYVYNHKNHILFASEIFYIIGVKQIFTFIDLYIIKFMDPKLINYLQQTGEAVSFYYSVQESKTGIKITFAIIYLLIVSLLLFLSNPSAKIGNVAGCYVKDGLIKGNSKIRILRDSIVIHDGTIGSLKRFNASFNVIYLIQQLLGNL
mgnify:CR=1 FL=1